LIIKIKTCNENSAIFVVRITLVGDIEKLLKNKLFDELILKNLLFKSSFIIFYRKLHEPRNY
jgi:hypothetical protein